MSTELTSYVANQKSAVREKLDYITITIASSGTTSTAADLTGKSLVGFYLPATFTGTTITFTGAPSSSGTFVAFHDGAGAAYSKTVVQNTLVPLNPADTASLQHVKLVSGSTEGAERTITLVTKAIS